MREEGASAKHSCLLQAVFVVTLYTRGELHSLQAALARLGIGHVDLQGMEQDLRLRIDFPLSASHSQCAPCRKLYMPRRLEDMTGISFVPAVGSLFKQNFACENPADTSDNRVGRLRFG